MKRRQRVEKYWSVWIFNYRAPCGGVWEPYEEGITTKRSAREEMRKEAEKHPDERFALVQTTNVRSPG